MIGTAALRPRPQSCKGDAAIRAAADEAESRNVENAIDLRLREHDVIDAPRHGLFLCKRGAFRQLDRDDEIALIFIWYEGRRRRAEHDDGRGERGNKDAGN